MKKRRKIGSLTPLWNQELFIKPHFEMLSKLDRNVVLMQPGPLPQYHKEHGYSRKKDLSEDILRKSFPNVEIYPGNYPTTMEFGSGLYNEGLAMMQDCDIVFRLDPDMLWTTVDWQRFIDFIQETNYDCYRMDFANDSINYYMTGDFYHGLKDAKEFDALAVNPKYFFTGVLDYPDHNTTVVDMPAWVCHHFRGWNKPKSTPNPEWLESDYAKQALLEYGDEGSWFECPFEIRTQMEEWIDELCDLKDVCPSCTYDQMMHRNCIMR